MYILWIVCLYERYKSHCSAGSIPTNSCEGNSYKGKNLPKVQIEISFRLGVISADDEKNSNSDLCFPKFLKQCVNALEHIF